MMRPLLLLVVLSGAIASHFRFGTMSWKSTTVVNEVEFSITLSWRRSAAPGTGPVCAGRLNYGDGPSKEICIDRTAESSAEDWVLGSTKMKWKYGAPNNKGSPWVASVTGCCRISNLMVLANEKHDIQAGVDLDLATESPIMQQLPVLYMFTSGGSPTFTVAVADAFGRVPSLTLLHSGSPVTLGNNSVATVDVRRKGWWPVGLRATFRGGFIPVDFIIIIKDPIKVCTGAGASCKTCSGDIDCAVGTCQINSNPVTTIDPGLCFFKGQESVFTVVATDANPCQRITIQNGGLPSGASISKANQSISPVERKVTWTPPSNANQIVCFSSYNNNGGYSSSVCALMKIGGTGAAPVITGFSPAKVTKSGGAVIEIAGTGMDSLAGGQCTFGTKVVIAQFVSDTKVTCQVPTMAAGLYDVKYRALPCGVETKISTQIELTQTPTVSALNPATNKAPNGFDSLDIDLTIFGSSFTTASGVVTDPKCKVGSKIFTGVIVAANQMTCAVTVTSAGTHLLSTSNDGDSFSNAYAFLVYELPGLSGFDVGTGLAPSTGGLVVALGSEFTEGSYCRLDISSDPYYYKPQVVVSREKIKCRLPPLGISGGPTEIAGDNSTVFKFFVCGEKAVNSCSAAFDVGYYQNTPGEVSAVSVSEGDGCTGVINVTVGNLDPMLGRLKCKFDANSAYIVEGDWLVGDVVACRVPTDIAVGDYKLKVTNDGTYFSEGGSAFKVTVAVPLVDGWIGGRRSTNNRGESSIKVVVKNVASGVDAVISLGGSDSDGDSDGEASELSLNLTGSTESLGNKIYIEVKPPAFDIPVGIFSALYLPVTVTAAGKTSCGVQMLNIYSECYSDTQCSNEGVCDQLTGRCLPSPCGIMCEECEPTMITSGIDYRDIDACGKCNRETGKCECIDGWGDLACTSPTCKKVGDYEMGGKLCPGSVTYDDCADDPSLAGRQVCQKGCDIQMKTNDPEFDFGTEYCPAEKATCNTNFFKFCECDEGWTGYECDIEIIEAPPPTPYVQPTCTTDNPNVCGSRFTTTCNPDLNCATTCDSFSPCETGTCTPVPGQPSYCKCDAGKIGLECEMGAGAGAGAGGSGFSASAELVASPFLALLSACVVLI